MVKDLVLHTPAAELLLTLDDAKRHLRVEHEDDDADITAAIAAASAYLDGYEGVLKRALVSQTWDYHLPCFSMNGHLRRIALPLPPLIGVDLITYVDLNGEEQTLDPAAYTVLSGRVCAIEPSYGKIWPSTRRQSRAVTIRYTCGYGSTADVPPSIISAARQIVGDLYENRSAQTIAAGAVNIVLNKTTENLLKPFWIART